jgi:hypothetical protein
MVAIRGERVLGYQLVDAFVAPNLQGRGIFRRLADRVFDDVGKRSQLFLAIGPTDMSLPIIVRKYGMYAGPPYRQVFSPIRLGDVLKAKRVRFVSPLGNFLSMVRNHALPIRSLTVEETTGVSPIYYSGPSAALDFAIIRDETYVRFRYASCPEPYRFFRAWSDRHDVVLIVKLVDWRGIRICYLVDVLGDTKCDGRVWFLCQAIHAIGTRTSSAVASVELHGPRSETSRLRLHGFFLHRREEVICLRQEKWSFLRPDSDDYDPRRWTILSGDSDHL